ncbi:MAG: tRNA pseudouridine(55) synthase TruB [Bacteroidaceae bacterium]|nr:tRNA pseudouridine(55) synthase TruB [Bacteroidaceae bacterium]
MDFEAGVVISFDKPYGWTSFDVVARVRGIVRRYLGVKKIKVGHAGTLDPLATGVLIVCTGKATKTIDTLQAETKEYVATLKLGATTPSFDMETAEDATFPTEHITLESVQEVLKQFVGTIEQIPPAYSALKVDGERSYKLARKGEEVTLKPKTLVIDEIEMLDFGLAQDSENSECTENPGKGYLRLVIRVVCSKGTYIRALARDIGVALGSGAYLTALRRTRIGDRRIEDCTTVEAFENMVDKLPSIKKEIISKKIL